MSETNRWHRIFFIPGLSTVPVGDFCGKYLGKLTIEDVTVLCGEVQVTLCLRHGVLGYRLKAGYTRPTFTRYEAADFFDSAPPLEGFEEVTNESTEAVL